MTDRHDNIAATRPDTTRRKDLESFKALAEIEGKEIISEQKITDDLFLRETRVTYESFDFYFESQDKTYRFNVRAIKDAIVSGKLPFVISIRPSNWARYSGVRNDMSSAVESCL